MNWLARLKKAKPAGVSGHAGVLVELDKPGIGAAANDPARSTPDVRDRLQKPATAPASSERPDPNAWRELAAAYHLHHFKCVVCIAAGRGAGYGPRCGAGAALWVAYQDSP